jgi:hypothetical protein
MTGKKFIRIDDFQILNKKILLFELSFSNDLKKYFKTNSFYVKYDEILNNISEEFLNIPAISSIIGLSWTVGANLHVNKMDKTYLESLGEIKDIFKKWYPQLAFDSEIVAEEITSNKFSSNKSGMLFSGGVDSTFTYVKHRDEKPTLYVIIGSGLPLDNKKYIQNMKSKLSDFADMEKVKINFIETNVRFILNEALLNFQFGRFFEYRQWWEGINLAVTLTGLCAPLTINKIGRFLIASSSTQATLAYYGSGPMIDSKIAWADVKVIHDGVETRRSGKMRYIAKNYVTKEGKYPTLRVCNYIPYAFHEINCNRCEKCIRTITNLVLENVDPKKCGFDITDGFFDRLKEKIIMDKLFENVDSFEFWRDIQRSIPDKIEHNLYDSRSFFEWLRDYELSNRKQGSLLLEAAKNNMFYFFSYLPRRAQESLMEIYYKRKISG